MCTADKYSNKYPVCECLSDFFLLKNIIISKLFHGKKVNTGAKGSAACCEEQWPQTACIFTHERRLKMENTSDGREIHILALSLQPWDIPVCLGLSDSTLAKTSQELEADFCFPSFLCQHEYVVPTHEKRC